MPESKYADVPLMRGEHTIGRARIYAATGVISGTIDPSYATVTRELFALFEVGASDGLSIAPHVTPVRPADGTATPTAGLDLAAIAKRHADMKEQYDQGDSAEFEISAVEALDDVPALLDRITKLEDLLRRAEDLFRQVPPPMSLMEKQPGYIVRPGGGVQGPMPASQLDNENVVDHDAAGRPGRFIVGGDGIPYGPFAPPRKAHP